MTTKKKITAAASAIILFIILTIILWSKLLTAAYRGDYTQVDSGRFYLAPDAADLMTPEGYNFDTGAGCSIIVSDSLPAIPFVGFGVVTDCHRQRRLITYSYLPNLPLNDSLTIEGKAYHKVIVPNSASSSHNLLGLDFLRRHDTMFWDSANRRMYLWNESPPPAVKEASPSGEEISQSTETQG